MADDAADESGTRYSLRPRKDKGTPDSKATKSIPTPISAPKATRKAAEPVATTGKRKRSSTGASKPASAKKSARIEPEGAVPVDDDLDFTAEAGFGFDGAALTALLKRFDANCKCNKCGDGLLSDEFIDSHVEAWSSGAAKHPSTPLSAFRCTDEACSTVTCLGCHGTPDENDSTDETHSCSDGWHASVWILLTYFDSKRGREPNGLQVSSSSKAKGSSKKKSSSSKSKSTWGRGNNPDPPQGTGYARGHSQALGKPKKDAASPTFEQPDTSKQDELDICVFELLAKMLNDRPHSSDAKTRGRSTKKRKPASVAATQDSALVAMLHWSKLPKAIAEIFRGESVEGASKRSKLYLSALDVVQALAEHEDTVPLVKDRTFDAFKAVSSSFRGTLLPSFELQMPSGKTDRNSFLLEDCCGTSISSSMADLVVSAEMQLKSAAKMPSLFRDKEGKGFLSFCRRISKAASVVHFETDEEQDEAPPPLFDMIDDAPFSRGFRYQPADGDASELPGSSVPKRMKSLYNEICLLKTSLPDGVYVRSAEDRPDMMRVLMVGPVGTPYENGLFEFHLRCTNEFPNKPPKVICTTSSRPEVTRFAMNPNLYNSGYVCLSLIGTWAGSSNEVWLPGKSTILQVLVSIHSMILGTATPADNEPGGMPMSHSLYNLGVQAGTIAGAMLPWLQDQELREGLWKDVINAHFKKNAVQIVEVTTDWSKDNPKIQQYRKPGHDALRPPALADLGPSQTSVEDDDNDESGFDVDEAMALGFGGGAQSSGTGTQPSGGGSLSSNVKMPTPQDELLAWYHELHPGTNLYAPKPNGFFPNHVAFMSKEHYGTGVPSGKPETTGAAAASSSKAADAAQPGSSSANEALKAESVHSAKIQDAKAAAADAAAKAAAVKGAAVKAAAAKAHAATVKAAKAATAKAATAATLATNGSSTTGATPGSSTTGAPLGSPATAPVFGSPATGKSFATATTAGSSLSKYQDAGSSTGKVGGFLSGPLSYLGLVSKTDASLPDPAQANILSKENLAIAEKQSQNQPGPMYSDDWSAPWAGPAGLANVFGPNPSFLQHALSKSLDLQLPPFAPTPPTLENLQTSALGVLQVFIQNVPKVPLTPGLVEGQVISKIKDAISLASGLPRDKLHAHTKDYHLTMDLWFAMAQIMPMHVELDSETLKQIKQIQVTTQKPSVNLAEELEKALKEFLP